MSKSILLVGSLLLLAAAASAQRIAVPAVYANTEGSATANIWRAGLNRVQCIYDSGNFTSQGVGVPITITHVDFRLVGGSLGSAVSYPSVEVYLQNSAVDHLAASSTFATNRTIALPTTPNYFGPVAVSPGAGTTPNSWVISIPLSVPFVYTGDADLLVELVILGSPTPNASTSVSSASVAAQHGCNSVRSSGSTTATTGIVTGFCPVVRFSYTPTAGGAAHVVYGNGCNTIARSFYELFAGGAVDLTNKTVALTPNAAGGYTVATTAGAALAPTAGAGLALGDSQVSSAIALPFTFTYPGGSTSSVFVDSNGSLQLDGAGLPNVGGSGASLLQAGQHTLAALMQDLVPDGATNTNNVFANADAAHPGTFVVTWVNVPCVGGAPGTRSTFQIALIDNGTADRVEFRYATVVNNSTTNGGAALVGFSLGNGALDGGGRDLTAGTFATAADLGPLTLGASPRPILGTPITYSLTNVRPLAGVSAINIAFASSAPTPLSAFGLNAPGCFGNIAVVGSQPFGPLLLAAPTASFVQNWPASPVYVGFTLFAQGFELAPAENAAGVITSNGLRIVLGTL